MSTAKLNEHHLQHLAEARAELLAEQKKIEAKVKVLNTQILETLSAADVQRFQLTTGPLAGSLVYIVAPSPRQSIVGEKLLGLGVSPDIIRASTNESPVKPYIRVDAPGAPTGAPNPQRLAEERQLDAMTADGPPDFH